MGSGSWGARCSLAAATLFAAACQSSTFACDKDEHCKTDEGTGQCERNGYCSFEDATCPSGRRYGALAGGGLAGFCVVDDAAGSGTTAAPTMTDGASGLPDTDADQGNGTSQVEGSAGADSTSADATDGTTGEPEASTSGDGQSSTGEPGDAGLVLWLTFEPEAEGVVSDASGNGHHALCDPGTCPLIVDDGPVGSAGTFDGVDDALFVAYDPALDLDEALSIAAWARMDAMPSDAYALVLGKSFGTQSANSYELYYTVDNNVMAFSMDAKTSGYVGEPWVTGVWVHLAGTWDGELMRLYVDGQSVGVAQTDNPPAFDEVPLLVGADLHYGAPGLYWPGAIDDVRVYDRQLSSDEVMALVALGSAP